MSGATGSSYLLGSADVGSTLRTIVTGDELGRFGERGVGGDAVVGGGARWGRGSPVDSGAGDLGDGAAGTDLVVEHGDVDGDGADLLHDPVVAV